MIFPFSLINFINGKKGACSPHNYCLMHVKLVPVASLFLELIDPHLPLSMGGQPLRLCPSFSYGPMKKASACAACLLHDHHKIRTINHEVSYYMQ